MTYLKLWIVGILSAILIIWVAYFTLAIDLAPKNSSWDLAFILLVFFIPVIQEEILMDKEEKAERNKKANEPMTKKQGIMMACSFLIAFLVLFLGIWLMEILAQNTTKMTAIIPIILLMGWYNVRAWKKYRRDKERMNNPND